MSLAPGSVFADFTVLRRLGSGGMGEVYLVRHPRLPREDALKVLPRSLADDANYRRRFNREADSAAGLWHPHVVGVHDRGEFDGQLWISMDYVEGSDAGQLLREGFAHGMPREDVFVVVKAVAEALDYAHGEGLLHRDVKPANILLTSPRSGKRRILLADFGIARRLDDTRGLTATNTTLGTLNYAAPEQLMGEAIDGRADQYALAATAFHLLSGRAPDGTLNPAALIHRRLSGPTPRIVTLRPDLADIDDVLAQAMARDPAMRFANCEDFAAAIAALRPMGFQASWPGRGSPPVRDFAIPAAGYPRDSAPTLSPPEQAPSSSARAWRSSMIVLAGFGAVLAVALVVVGILLVGDRPTRDVSSTGSPTLTTAPTSQRSQPSSVTVTPAAPVLPSDVDVHGFTTFGGGARCFGTDEAQAFMRTLQSALVVCRSEIGQLYYRGLRLSDGAGIDLHTVYPQNGGYVAINDPDDARYEIDAAGLRIVQNGNTVAYEPALEHGP